MTFGFIWYQMNTTLYDMELMEEKKKADVKLKKHK